MRPRTFSTRGATNGIKRFFSGGSSDDHGVEGAANGLDAKVPSDPVNLTVDRSSPDRADAPVEPAQPPAQTVRRKLSKRGRTAPAVLDTHDHDTSANTLANAASSPEKLTVNTNASPEKKGKRTSVLGRIGKKLSVLKRPIGDLSPSDRQKEDMDRSRRLSSISPTKGANGVNGNADLRRNSHRVAPPNEEAGNRSSASLDLEMPLMMGRLTIANPDAPSSGTPSPARDSNTLPLEALEYVNSHLAASPIVLSPPLPPKESPPLEHIRDLQLSTHMQMRPAASTSASDHDTFSPRPLTSQQLQSPPPTLPQLFSPGAISIALSTASSRPPPLPEKDDRTWQIVDPVTLTDSPVDSEQELPQNHPRGPSPSRSHLQAESGLRPVSVLHQSSSQHSATLQVPGAGERSRHSSLLGTPVSQSSMIANPPTPHVIPAHIPYIPSIPSSSKLRVVNSTDYDQIPDEETVSPIMPSAVERTREKEREKERERDRDREKDREKEKEATRPHSHHPPRPAASRHNSGDGGQSSSSTDKIPSRNTERERERGSRRESRRDEKSRDDRHDERTSRREERPSRHDERSSRHEERPSRREERSSRLDEQSRPEERARASEKARKESSDREKPRRHSSDRERARQDDRYKQEEKARADDRDRSQQDDKAKQDNAEREKSSRKERKERSSTTERFKLIRTPSDNIRMLQGDGIVVGEEQWTLVEASSRRDKSTRERERGREKEKDRDGERERGKERSSPDKHSSRPADSKREEKYDTVRSDRSHQATSSRPKDERQRSTITRTGEASTHVLRHQRSRSLDDRKPSVPSADKERKSDRRRRDEQYATLTSDPRSSQSKTTGNPRPSLAAPNGVDRHSTSRRPVSEVHASADMMAREAWDAERMWKGKSAVYEPEGGLVIPGIPPSHYDPRYSGISMNGTAGSFSNVDGMYGSSHTGYVVQSPFHGHVSHQNSFYAIPVAAPPTMVYAAQGYSPPGPYDYPHAYRSYADSVPFPTADPQAPLQNPLPEPPRHSTYSPEPLRPGRQAAADDPSTQEYWSIYAGITTH